MVELAREWRSQPSPPLSHLYPPPTLQQQQQQPPLRRLSEARHPGGNNNPPIPGARPPPHQHGGDASSSNPHRRSPSSSPASYPLGRSLTEPRVRDANNNIPNNHRLGASSSSASHSHPDRDGRGPGPSNGIGGGSGSGPAQGLGHGGSDCVYNEREKEVNGRRLISEMDIDPVLQNGINGVVGGAGSGVAGGGGGPLSGGGGGLNGNGNGNGGPRGHPEGQQSLPSLKASGLLDSWNSSSRVGEPQKVQQQPQGAINGVQQRSPRRSPPHPPHESDARSVTLGMPPVGLSWLVNESR